MDHPVPGLERKVERIRLMRSLATRYFLAVPEWVWHLILHNVAAESFPEAPPVTSSDATPVASDQGPEGMIPRAPDLAEAPRRAFALAVWLRSALHWTRRFGATPSEDGGPMKITPWYLAALAPFAAIGCSGAYLGHAAVVLLTIGIFWGTLSLGRTAQTPPTQPPTIS